MSPAQIAVIGAGSWGTTLSLLAARAGQRVRLWVRDPDQAARLARTRENTRYLPGIALPAAVTVTSDLPTAVAGAAMIALVVPSPAMREIATRVAPAIGDAVIVSAVKGIEPETLLRMSQVVADVMPAARDRICALSGPNLAVEIAGGKPAASVVAGPAPAAAWARDVLMSEQFRCYTSDDVVGVELAGALKNIIAIGAGLGDGLVAGDNAKATFMTRGLAEIGRLGVAAGANPLTFAGLAGIGDLVTTCASPLSRNYRLGLALAGGRPLPEILADLGQVAEGVNTTASAVALGARYGVELPITRQMHEILFNGKPPLRALADLMGRDARNELDWIAPGPGER